MTVEDALVPAVDALGHLPFYFIRAVDVHAGVLVGRHGLIVAEESLSRSR